MIDAARCEVEGCPQPLRFPGDHFCVTHLVPGSRAPCDVYGCDVWISAVWRLPRCRGCRKLADPRRLKTKRGTARDTVGRRETFTLDGSAGYGSSPLAQDVLPRPRVFSEERGKRGKSEPSTESP